VNSGTILSLIDQGATTVREVKSASGASEDCGKCAQTIRMLLEQRREASAETQPGGSS
jgi:bacterioferritin-associated ferredoxin